MTISNSLLENLTYEDKKTKLKIGWCFNCNITVLIQEGRIENCPRCKEEIKKMTNDVRPVFARERKILEYYGIDCMENTVWKSMKSKQYFIDGESYQIPNLSIIQNDISNIRSFINLYSLADYENIDKNILNDYKESLSYCDYYLRNLESQAFEFIEEKLDKHHNKTAVVSFSGVLFI